MTEADWLACKSLDRALAWLRKKVSNRKLRLFACACCRQVDDLLTEQTVWKTLATAEEYAECRISRHDLRAAREAAAPEGIDFSDMAGHVARIGVVRATHEMAWQAARQASSVAAEAGNYRTPAQRARGPAADQVYQNQLTILRDIFNPFRPVKVDPAWLTPTVVSLAQAAYDERHLPKGTLDTARLAILADALEDAGCTSQDVIGHLRGPGIHVRGCWVVDALLGKS